MSMIQYFNFRVPQGMALQPYADGSYNIVYDSSKIVQLRDWCATLTNVLSESSTQYLHEQKIAKEKELKERNEKARRLALPDYQVKQITKESQRVNHIIPMMGDDEVPGGVVLNQPKTIPPKKPVVAASTTRKVQTDQGEIDVAADVSDDDLVALGYVVSGAKPDETNEQKSPVPTDTNDAQSTSPDAIDS